MFLILIENPSGHGKKIEGVSNTAGMIVRLSGGNKKMRKRTINKLGTHPTQLGVGNSQSLFFSFSDVRPFYLPGEGQKSDTFSGEKIIRKKSKKMLLENIKTSGYHIRGNFSKEKLNLTTNSNGEPLHPTIPQHQDRSLDAKTPSNIIAKWRGGGLNSFGAY